MTHTVYLSDPIIGRNENVHKCCVNAPLTQQAARIPYLWRHIHYLCHREGIFRLRSTSWRVDASTIPRQGLNAPLTNDVIDEVRPQPYLYNPRHNNNYVPRRSIDMFECVAACDNAAHLVLFGVWQSRAPSIFFLFLNTLRLHAWNRKNINRWIHVEKDWSSSVNRHVKRTLSSYFRNLPLLHITIRLHLTWRLLKFMQWLARKQYLLRRRSRQIRWSCKSGR